jgi:hypothetical protein
MEYAVLGGTIALVAFGILILAPLPDAIGKFGDKISACVSFGELSPNGMTCD